MFHLLEWGSNPLPVGFTVTLCAPAPRLASIDLIYSYMENSSQFSILRLKVASKIEGGYYYFQY